MGATPRYPCLLYRTTPHQRIPCTLSTRPKDRNTALGFLANTVQFSLFFCSPTHPVKEIASLGKPVVCQSEDCPGIPHDTVSFLRAQCESISSSTGDNCYTQRDIHFSPVEGAGAHLHNPVNRPEVPSPQAPAGTCPWLRRTRRKSASVEP